MDKLRIIVVLLILFSFSQGSYAATKSGSIWTTFSDCGEIKQDVNHYAIGDTVYVHGENFDAGTHAWMVMGQPGKASSDPRQTVASGDVVVDQSGSFCFAAYVVQPGDDGEYKVEVAKKHDNYRVRGEQMITCEEAVQAGLLSGSISGNAAIVENNAGSAFEVSLVSYQMYAPIIEDQTIFDTDTKTVDAGDTVQLAVDVPACAFQLDLICGEPITPPFYDILLDSVIETDQDFCVWEPQGSDEGVSATLSIADFYPQGSDYVFVCEEDGFDATGYNWYFGDGQYLFDADSSVFHTYDPGEYTVACRAEDGGNWAVGTMDVVVG